MSNNFDTLTISNNYIFCCVMQDDSVCKELLTMLLQKKIGKPVKLIHQKEINNYIGAKGTRLDIMVQDDSGCLYDVEMQVTNEKNLEKRMRYYQCAIDSSALDKGGDYNQLANTVIIFLCTFDYLHKGLPLYTIQPTCTETNGIFQDGTVKILVNSKAAEKAEGELKGFLEYMNGKAPKTEFTKKLEELVNKTKQDEQKRREYMLIQSFEMDARRSGIEQGIQQGIQQSLQRGIQQGLQQGIQQGKSLGLAEGKSLGIAEGMQQGVYRKSLETAKNLIEMGLSIETIAKATGLSQAEVAALQL